MGRTESLKVACVLLASLAWSIPATAEGGDVLRCSRLSDQVSALVKAGKVDAAREHKAALEQCLPILEAELQREAERTAANARRLVGGGEK